MSETKGEGIINGQQNRVAGTPLIRGFWQLHSLAARSDPPKHLPADPRDVVFKNSRGYLAVLCLT